MIRILHAADLHLDSPFAAMPPEKARQRRAEQREVLVRLIRECDARSCDLLLLAGDLFDSGEVYRDTTELLLRLLGQCRARVFIAPGNHDFFSPASVYNTLPWPENVHIFRSETVEAVRLAQPAATVYGAAFTGPHASGLLRGFHAAQDGKPAIMVLHGELSEQAGRYNTIHAADVENSGLSYLALGHIHEDSFRTVGKTAVGNPGCAMGRGFDELGEKGAFYLEIDVSDCRAEAVPLGAKQYRVLRVRVNGDAQAAVEAALPDGTDDWICRLILEGSCPAPDLRALHAALDGRFDTLEILDRTLPPAELWEGEGDDSLRGAFLRSLHAQFDAASGEAQQIVALAARIGRDLMDGREVQAE